MLQVKLSEAHLNHHLHEVFLSNHVLATDDLLQNTRQNSTLVHIEVYTIQLAKADKVSSNKNSKFASLQFSLFSIPRVSLMLQTNPKLIHFNKVRQHE